jgi:large subunit ribosomal protein L9
MKIILTADVPDLGMRGDVVDVADGYARNYLVPRAMAVKATAGAMRDAEKIRLARQEEAEKEKEAAEAISEALTGTTIVVSARAADEGKLFGSIGARDVGEAIAKNTGFEIPHEQIRLPGPIKEIGLHAVTIKAHPEVSIQLVLDVIPA